MQKHATMCDIQNSSDQRGIAIQRVGINHAHLPFLIKTKDGDFQQVLADICFTVSLPEEYKGTHMSRFLGILNQWSKHPIAEPEMERILCDALQKLNAASAALEIHFKYFVEREAPVSREKSYLDLDCCFYGEKHGDQPFSFTLGVDVPVTSLCPCSKEISVHGAHNQRSLIRARVRFFDGVDCIFIEDLASLLEAQASCAIYPLLKRVDEKYVTEHAYENPKFVEDMLRDAILALRALSGISWFSVACENYESIHNHNAFASHEETVRA